MSSQDRGLRVPHPLRRHLYRNQPPVRRELDKGFSYLLTPADTDPWSCRWKIK